MRLFKLNKEQTLIIGATFDEACTAHETIVTATKTHSHVLCIVDQHLDYSEGSVLGTDILGKLFATKNLNIVAFIRSGNDTVDDVAFYRSKGAYDGLSKSSSLKSLAIELLMKYQQALACS